MLPSVWSPSQGMGGCQSCGRYEEDEEHEAVGEGAELADTDVARRNMELVTIVQLPPDGDETMEAAELEGEGKALIEKKKLRDLRWAEREKLDCAVGDGDGPKRTLAASKDKRSKMPHRDLQVLWEKCQGKYIEHMLFGWHH